MGINYLFYLLEIIIVAIVIIAGIIFFDTKKKKGFLTFLGITMATFVVIFGLTFFFERPEIRFREEKDNDVKIFTADEIVLEAKIDKELKRPVVFYHFQDISDRIIIKDDNVDYDKVGDYRATYEVETITGIYVKEVKIHIVDHTAPEISLEGGEDYNQSYSKEFEEPGYKAIDQVDGDVTESVVFNKEEIDDKNFKIVYEVEDLSGNKARVVRNVKIIDDIEPELTLNGSSSMTLYLNNKYEEKGASATDEVDGDLTDKIVKEGSVDTSKEGKYTITYTVSDNSGNKAVKERTITVREKPVLVQNNSNPDSGSKVVYLTFDDGPSSYTGALLDTLKRYNVKATFFVTKNGSDAMIKREYDEGHTVALHTNSHNYAYIYESPENFFEDLYAVQARVERITGEKVYLMRFPGGSSNTVSKSYDGGMKIMSYLTAEVQNRGFTYFDWNVSSGDAGGTTTTSGVYNNVVSKLKPGSSVVLQHDVKKFSVDAVAQIIEYGLSNGYTFRPLTASSPTAHHSVNN